MSTTGIALDTCLMSCDPAGVAGATGGATKIASDQAAAAQLAASIGLGTKVDAYA